MADGAGRLRPFVPKIMIIVGSVRPIPGRKGTAVANWVRERLSAVDGVEIDVADLLEVGLPFYDELLPAALGKYEHEHTKAWAARVAQADGFILVNPEFNGSFTAGVKNALDYLYAEWGRKPFAFVNYCSTGGGNRAAMALQQVITALGMLRVRPELAIAMINDHVVDGVFEPSAVQENLLQLLFADLLKLAEGLKPLR